MDVASSETRLDQDGYGETGVKELPEAPRNTAHGHAFDARALILEGEITLTVDGRATVSRPGDVFDMPAGCAHSETVPTGGVRYLYGLRHQAAPASPPPAELPHRRQPR